jgi:bifunctional non-homologous end joining protein LigD
MARKKVISQPSNTVQMTLFGHGSLKPPEPIKPMLALLNPHITLRDVDDLNTFNPFRHNPEPYMPYVAQRKYDGNRVLAIKRGDVINLMSRSWKNDFAEKGKYKELVDDLLTIDHDFIIDGELTFFNKETGKNEFVTANARDLTRARYTWKYFPFDILSFDGHDKSHLPFIERDAFLKSIIPGDLNYVQTVETHTDPNTFAEIYDTIMQEHGEGLVLKMPDSPYQFGKRNANWIKVKKCFDEDCFVYAITNGTGKRAKTFGALVLGQWVWVKSRQQYAIKNVGLCSGFTDEEHQELYDSIMQMPESKYYDRSLKTKEGVKRWVEPKMVVEVRYMEKSDYGIMRHPVFVRVRDDKEAKECIFEWGKKRG